MTLRRTANSGEPMTDRDLRLPGQVRRIVRAHLNQWGIGVGITETAELLVSELVANTLRHGTDTSGEFRVHVWCAGQCVRMEVGNGGPLNPAPRPAVPPTVDAADLSESGRGLTLVDALADDWGISPDGTRTWCVLDIPGGE
ncbi:ATP-binding protein [Streptomyces katsurahamanus]|uniref:ATP-binding protein n=1 Tax=Streptomyces katsurahamanus TaxID=2577098 RepID=A0ABW9P088_9ACTN|nr:ATP-binding protein [Streptomyces katsurahamanus]MQS38993.1 ATP-binding protein [Streptomyces katsurahamanus]